MGDTGITEIKQLDVWGSGGSAMCSSPPRSDVNADINADVNLEVIRDDSEEASSDCSTLCLYSQ